MLSEKIEIKILKFIWDCIVSINDLLGLQALDLVVFKNILDN